MRIGELIARRRGDLSLSQDDLAARLVEVSGRTTLDREIISRWEREKRVPGPMWLGHLAEALETTLTELRSSVQFTKRLRRSLQEPFDQGLSLLLSADEEKELEETAGRVSVDTIEKLLSRSYSLDDEFGGGSLWRQIDMNIRAASDLFSRSLTLAEGNRLRQALGGLTQIAGWLSIDASRHAQANKNLTAALYAAYETDDDALAAHVLGYMSLHAFYRDRTREAASLARTSLDRAHVRQTPALHAILSARLARCLARLGEADACRRALDSFASTADQTGGDSPLWLEYVDTIELVAQRGACFLDLGDFQQASDATEEAISLLQSKAPNRTRDLAHYKIRLASVHIRQHDLDRAMSAAQDAYVLTTQIDSARINERFNEMVSELSQFGSAAVRDTLDSFHADPRTT